MTTQQTEPTDDPLVALEAEYVERGRQLVKAGESTNWELGDYILEGFPIGEHGVNTGVAEGIRLLSAQIGGEPETLTQCRKVSHSWPREQRLPNATWAAHMAYLGDPASAWSRRKVLESLPRNEHGMITKRAVRDLTKGASGGKPGWQELIGRVGDDLTKAVKDLDAAEAALTRQPNEKFREKAGKYADWCEALTERLRVLERGEQPTSTRPAA